MSVRSHNNKQPSPQPSVRRGSNSRQTFPLTISQKKAPPKNRNFLFHNYSQSSNPEEKEKEEFLSHTVEIRSNCEPKIVPFVFPETGINTDTVDEPFKEMAEDLKCIICLSLATDPVQCRSCKAIFCLKCSDKIKANHNLGQKCPMRCQGRFTTVKIDKLAEKLMDKIVISCYQGCGQLIKYGDIKKHYEECVNTRYMCSSKECGFTGSKDEVREHENECELTKVFCAVCKKYVLRKEKDRHDKEECPDAVVECPFCYQKMRRDFYKLNHYSVDGMNPLCLKSKVAFIYNESNDAKRKYELEKKKVKELEEKYNNEIQKIKELEKYKKLYEESIKKQMDEEETKKKQQEKKIMDRYRELYNGDKKLNDIENSQKFGKEVEDHKQNDKVIDINSNEHVIDIEYNMENVVEENEQSDENGL